jgi:hypothetical protein
MNVSNVSNQLFPHNFIREIKCETAITILAIGVFSALFHYSVLFQLTVVVTAITIATAKLCHIIFKRCFDAKKHMPPTNSSLPSVVTKTENQLSNEEKSKLVKEMSEGKFESFKELISPQHADLSILKRAGLFDEVAIYIEKNISSISDNDCKLYLLTFRRIGFFDNLPDPEQLSKFGLLLASPLYRTMNDKTDSLKNFKGGKYDPQLLVLFIHEKMGGITSLTDLIAKWNAFQYWVLSNEPARAFMDLFSGRLCSFLNCSRSEDINLKFQEFAEATKAIDDEEIRDLSLRVFLGQFFGEGFLGENDLRGVFHLRRFYELAQGGAFYAYAQNYFNHMLIDSLSAQDIVDLTNFKGSHPHLFDSVQQISIKSKTDSKDIDFLIELFPKVTLIESDGSIEKCLVCRTYT